MSINPNFWGPGTWRMLHSMAACYDPSKAEKFKALVWALSGLETGLLPCSDCRRHFTSMLSEPELNLEHYLHDRDRLFLWTWIIHDRVNDRLGKQRISLRDAKRIYFSQDRFYPN